MKKQELQALLVALGIAAALVVVLLVVRSQIIDEPPPSVDQESTSEQQNLPLDQSEKPSPDEGAEEEKEVIKRKSVMESLRPGGGDTAMQKHLDIIKQSSRN